MHSTPTHIPLSIRFRRWSRAGYAVFRSLGCTVTIGALVISISDKSLVKTNHASVQFGKDFEVSAFADSSFEESAEIEENVLVQTIHSLHVTQDVAAPRGNTTYINKPMKRLKGLIATFNRFFYSL
jgi:hypothetical protein